MEVVITEIDNNVAKLLAGGDSVAVLPLLH